MSFLAAFLTLVSVSVSTPALADAVVYSACGQANYGTAIGQSRASTQDNQGNGCVTGTFTGPISGNVGILNSSGTRIDPSTSGDVTGSQASPGSDAARATAVQGVTGGKPVSVSASSLPLPTGAATAANQTNGAQLTGVLGANGTGIASNANPVPANIISAIPSGTNVVGKVGIDQTTPGTTNAVSATNFPATVATGTGAQGATVPRFTVATDSATVAGSSSIPAGTNLIGKVQDLGADGSTGASTSNPLPTAPTPSATAGFGLSPVSSTSLEANHVIKSGAGNLYGFEISADSTLSASAWWVMVYNATSAPADGAVTPVKCYAVPSGTTSFAASFTTFPIAFGTGITIGVSTTGCFTKTASAHAFISGDAK